MANEGPNTNASQFFLTLDQTPELQGKNTMFGRVEGDTIYNLMKMADAELVGLEEGNERPLYPTKVTGAEILVNPFEDMIARATEAPRSTDVGGRKEVKKRKKPAGKNTLSFGGEDGEEEAAPVLKKVKANPKLVVVEEEPAPKPAPKPRREKPVQENPPREELKAEVKIAKPPSRVEEPISEDEEEESEDEREKRRRRVLENTNAEIAALKASMKRTNDAKSHEKEKPKSALEAMIPTTSIRGRKRGKASDEHGAMDIFKAFQSRLAELPAMKESDSKEPDQGVDPTTGAADEPADDEAELCDLHFIANCLSCKAWDGEQPDGEVEEDEDETSWMAHSLSFAKDTKARQDDWKTKMDQYEVIDPREKARELEEKRKKEKGSNGDRSRMKR
jgi:peptidyl-prolyl cis-trans isomerase SDCCAG10